MSSEIYARVVFESPLPALSREFEYVVEESLRNSVRIGQRVRVPFAGQTKEGFIVGLSTEREFPGNLNSISEIVSPIPVFTPESYKLAKAIADRQCCSIGELIGNFVPKRAVRVEKSFEYVDRTHKSFESGERFAEFVPAYSDSVTGEPHFLERISKLVQSYLKESRSVIVCVPDFRDLERVYQKLQGSIGNVPLFKIDSSEVSSERYLSFLNQLTVDVGVVLGTRNAIYSPIHGSAALVIWDDGDQSHQDQQAPYLTTREIALIRQSLFSCPLHFLSHSRSTEIQRLVNIGYLESRAKNNWHPKIAISEGAGLDGMTFQLIKRGVSNGPVLVQVAAPGVARSLYCAECETRSMCRNCSGPLWLNGNGQIVCRWCGQFNLDFSCSKCSNTKLKYGSGGSTRWAKQLGQSFPGIPVREVTADQTTAHIPNRPSIVVATPGVEPIALGGYSAVVLLDCASQLRVDSLRAPEDALRSWLNAIAFMREGGEAIAVGVTSEVSPALSLGAIEQTVNAILKEREELGFPPARRFVSATGSRLVVEELAKILASHSAVRVLGISQGTGKTQEPEFRLVASFSYSSGNEVSNLIRNFQSTLGAKAVRTNIRSGRALRPVSIKFDDPRVI